MTHAAPPGARRLVIAIVVVGVLGVLAVAGAVGYGLWLRGAPSQADAQRECRTAVEREFHRRLDNAGSGKDVMVTVTKIDLDETSKTAGGWQVNYTVHYSATAALVGSVPNTLSLTCNAKVQDRKLGLEVVNRA